MTNPPSARLLSQLASLLGPSGFTSDPDAMAPWLIDWRGRFQGAAPALLSPSTREEAVKIVRLCAAEGVALVPQGGNTSMVGGATPGGEGSALLLSLRRMNRIRSISSADNVAICDAGVILSSLHDAAVDEGRRFPLSLGARGSATVGGLISTNAGGTQVLRFGTMRSLVAGIEAVLPDGTLLDALAPLRKDNRGYDIKQMLIGAEGTLGVVTAATLRLFPLPQQRAVAWLGVQEPAKALLILRRLEEALGEAVESFELVPRVAIDLVLAHIPGARPPLEKAHAWNVLVEVAGSDVEVRFSVALDEAIGAGLAADAVIAASGLQAEAFWRLRESIAEAERADGPAAKHDISVAVSAMPGFIVEGAAKVEERFPGTRVIAFGHLGDGNIHFNVRAPAGAGSAWPQDEGQAVTRFVHDLVTAGGGSISAEHGIGQLRLAELARLGDPARLAAQRAIKRALDPQGIMNPGKLIPGRG